jgi:hypothetical protein
MDKNIQPQQKEDLNHKEHPEKRDKRNYKTNEVDSSEENTKDGDLKPTNNISVNIHIKPAEEQQFENKD